MAPVAGGLATAVEAVVREDPTGLSVQALQERYASLAPQVQRLTGFGGAVLAELQARTGGLLPTEDGKPRPLPGWVAEVGGDSAYAAGRMLRVATALQSGLPRVAAAVLDGTVPFVRAEVLTRLVGKIAPAALAEAQDGLIVTAQVMDPQQLADYVRHLLATWVEPVVEDAEADASARRYLKTRQQPDGSLWGSFLLPAGDAETVLTGLEPLARKQGDTDDRSASQRRADALVETFDQSLRHGELPLHGGFRPQLSYVLPADWAARQAGQHTCPDCRPCPAHQPTSFADLIAAGLPGTPGATAVSAEHACAVAAWTGPQTRARIETILCDARITRVLLSSLGQVRGLESITDDVTPAQRRALAARDGRCTARGCTRPPAMCDAHHLTARADGGPTTLHNVVLLCRRHHVLWHLGKLTLHDLHVPWITDSAAGPAPPEPPRDADQVLELFGR
jgi:hypothetical protein